MPKIGMDENEMKLEKKVWLMTDDARLESGIRNLASQIHFEIGQKRLPSLF